MQRVGKFFMCHETLCSTLIHFIKRIISLLQINEHAKKKSAKLSGGTKRKLTYALSMFASPNINLLGKLLKYLKIAN